MAEEARSSGPATPTEAHLLTVVVPVYNEAENIIPLLEQLPAAVVSRHETLLVYDMDEDTTLPPARLFLDRYPSLRLVKNSVGPGVLNALKTGVRSAKGDVVVVTMADLSDDITQVETMSSLIREGSAVVAASRYMKGGSQIGGPPVKRVLSRLAGVSLRWLTRIGTHDATNNFKAYSAEFLAGVEIESRQGFEIGLELASKAHLGGWNIAEIPTTWRDRTAGESRFQVLAWLPAYLRWYSRCIFGTWAGQRRRAVRARSRVATSSVRQPADESRG